MIERRKKRKERKKEFEYIIVYKFVVVQSHVFKFFGISSAPVKIINIFCLLSFMVTSKRK